MAKKSKPYGGGRLGYYNGFRVRKVGNFFGQNRDDDILGFKMPRVDKAKAEGLCKQQIVMLYVGGDKGIGTGVNGGHDEILSRAAAKGDL